MTIWYLAEGGSISGRLLLGGLVPPRDEPKAIIAQDPTPLFMLWTRGKRSGSWAAVGKVHDLFSGALSKYSVQCSPVAALSGEEGISSLFTRGTDILRKRASQGRTIGTDCGADLTGTRTEGHGRMGTTSGRRCFAACPGLLLQESVVYLALPERPCCQTCRRCSVSVEFSRN